ncbi:hypothetical protein DXG01_016367 [Tephrocybe rancida]|nr:hypothetical protein DXG01_016367 [Tephrocybe rancida]
MAGTSTINTGLFINGAFVKPVDPDATIEVVNPVTGKLITPVSAGSKTDLDVAVDAALKAYKTTWGLKTSGAHRGRLLNKLADLLEARKDEFSALESLNVGKSFFGASAEIKSCYEGLRYYAGWADKNQGKTVETNDQKFAYTRREPYGVVGAIVAWNFPLSLIIMKLAPALATGNTVIIKPSEVTPLTALALAGLFNEAGFPPGVINIVNGLGAIVGAAISAHSKIGKITFTGSTLVGRKIMEASAASNLKSVNLELGGKNPNIIFDDANIEQAVKWSAMGLFYNAGQTCYAGTRLYVQEGVYDTFVEHFSAAAKGLAYAVGDPFAPTTQHAPLVSQMQLDRVMTYIESGKNDGATLLVGGKRLEREGFFIEPTIFTETKPEMKIVKEEIFGPVAVIIKFSTEEGADTYILAPIIIDDIVHPRGN